MLSQKPSPLVSTTSGRVLSSSTYSVTFCTPAFGMNSVELTVPVFGRSTTRARNSMSCAVDERSLGASGLTGSIGVLHCVAIVIGSVLV